MKQEDLNRLFDKARMENSRIPAEEILNKSLGATAGVWRKIRKATGIAFAILASLVISWLLNKEPISGGKVVQLAGYKTESKDSQQGHTPAMTELPGRGNTGLPASVTAQAEQDQTGTKAPLSIYRRSSSGQAAAFPQAAPLRGNLEQLYAASSKASEYHEIHAERDTVLISLEGSKIFIESESFCHSDGKPARGKLLFEFKECYILSDFLRENLGTATRDAYLETAGMFYMQASKPGDTLKLRKGYDIGFTPHCQAPERMDLYSGKRDSLGNICWELDPLGKRPSPVLIAVRGKYGNLLNPWFRKNYKLSKESMMELLDSAWQTHFTSYERVLRGTRSCREESGAFREACEEFNQVLAPQIVGMKEIPGLSFMTDFQFRCMSKNQYAYAFDRGFIDSFRNYVSPASQNYMDLPRFFPSTMGWSNLDCVPRSMVKKWKNYNQIPKKTLSIAVPGHLKVNAYLYIPAYRSIARSVNTGPELHFMNIPEDHSAYLVLSSFLDEVFYMYKTELNTLAGLPSEITFKRTENADEYLQWLQDALPEPEN